MLDYDVYRKDAAMVYTLRGKIELVQTATLRRIFWDCLHEDGIDRLIIDLSGVPELGSSAISLFVSTKNVVTKRRAKMIFIGLSQAAHDFLVRMHLHYYFDIAESLEEAMLLEEAISENPE